MNPDIEKQTCREVVKIIPYWDKFLADKQSFKYRKHMENCSTCQEQYQKTSHSLMSLERHIPGELGKKDQIVAIKQEAAALYRNFLTKNEIGLRGNLKKCNKFLQVLLTLEKEISRILFSKEMAKYYLMAVVLGVSLKWLID